MSEWIKCSERMPDYATNVLVYITNGEPHEWWIMRARLNGSLWDYDAKISRTRYRNIAVTHWMPLPEPPKESL